MSYYTQRRFKPVSPKKIADAPTSWDDLYDPKYKGRVGLYQVMPVTET